MTTSIKGDPILHRRGLAGENHGPSARHMHRQIDEDVDAVFANQAAERLIIECANIAPHVGVAGDAPRVIVGALDTGIADGVFNTDTARIGIF
jgi:hypothetical protein